MNPYYGCPNYHNELTKINGTASERIRIAFVDLHHSTESKFNIELHQGISTKIKTELVIM